ncbi:holo-ACP synthase [Eremococcus coleocola]|uniref:Holo-[acyl-carrier-protein] synthase n=1 Tax=Eremococcus coleocola ACS-139-V-Col8 TaxID=908337 RepID=E4KQV8_9LACT|nr:holo-ACP synthase [Eremococcus coleocola]EFR30733.1 holo-[acyl-carrier-protein] synthase [Eremococcus coleocola ACS-139-V-Col8]
MKIGIDIVEIDRIASILAKFDNFPQKILTEQELEVYQDLVTRDRKLAFLAGRFAAKEAYAKALGTGLGAVVQLKGLSVMNNQAGQPYFAQAPIMQGVALSISHERHYAVSSVIINQGDQELNQALQALQAKK